MSPESIKGLANAQVRGARVLDDEEVDKLVAEEEEEDEEMGEGEG